MLNYTHIVYILFCFIHIYKLKQSFHIKVNLILVMAQSVPAA